MSLSILVPYRSDSAHRTRIHAFTSGLWAATGLEVVYDTDGAQPGEPFSYARAVNRCRKKATGDCFLNYSVDALPPSPLTLAGLNAVLGSGIPWIAGWRGQTRFCEGHTDDILRGTHPETYLPNGGISWGREALVAVRADVWDKLGGYDERFVGWGPEDKAWFATVHTLYPEGWANPTEGFFKTLWHPPVQRSLMPKNLGIFADYRRECQDREGFRKWYFSGRKHTT